MHTEFSARDSLLRVKDAPRIAKELGWNAVAITDHGAIEGVLLFMDACKEVGIRALVGCELYLSTADSERFHHLTVLAKNATGFGSICAALSAAAEFSVGNKKRIAACPIAVALDVLHDVVILSGCFSSPFWRPAGDADLQKWVDKFHDDFFFEVQPLSDWSLQIDLNRIVQAAAAHYQRPVVVTPDCHFAAAKDAKMHEALLAFGNRAVLGSGDDKWKFSTKLNYLMTPMDIGEHLSRAGFGQEEAAQAVLSTDLVADRISDWSFEDLPKPAIPIVEGDFSVMARGAFEKRDFAGDPEYVSRFEEELRVFTEAGLGNYFLLVCECLRIFREHGAMIGPRGSVGGSLIAYLLGIASLDPVKHDIPYWRFWYPGRAMPNATGLDGQPILGPDGKPKTGTPPDIDIDLPVGFHGQVGPLLRERFGADKVAQISTVGTFGIRSAVRAAAHTYGIKLPEYDDWQANPQIPEEYVYYHDLTPEAKEFALALINRVEKYGAHPGGFVISAEPLTFGRSAIVRRGKGTTMCWDMDGAERLGFLKIDFLGNASMDALSALVNALDVTDIESIPLEDPQVLQDFREGRTAGIPQFSTAGMRTFTEMVGPQSFKDLVWINAAYRKGAIVAAGSPREMATAFHTNPDSVLVFQEELMLFCRELAGLSWEETDKIRKICAKSKGPEEMAKWHDKFVDGCERIGVLNRESASVLWHNLESAGSYLFGTAHASSYGATAARIAWLKRQNPVIAFTALLNVIGDKEEREPLIDEAALYGVEIAPPDPNKSAFHWVADGQKIFMPLQHADGADMRVAKAIMLRRTVREVKKGKKTITVGGPFKDQADFTAKMGPIGKVQYKAKDGTVKHKAAGIQRPDWFDERLWNPRPRRTAPPTLIDKDEAKVFRDVVKDCERCELRATCKAPVPPDFGKTNVLVLGDSPGKRENQYGRPFIGRSGEMLFGMLEQEGVYRPDVTIMNAVSCLPTDPESADAAICPWTDKYIEHWKPPLVLAVGRRAWQLISGLGKRAPGIMKANGTLFYRTNVEVPFGIVPCVHPAAVMRDNSLVHELERAVKKFARLFELSRAK